MNATASLRLFFFTVCCLSCFHQVATAQPIDRRALVERHHVVVDGYLPHSPLSVGNGEFAYTFDCTGMQTFPREEPGDLPLGTMAQWNWHTFPERKNYSYEDTLRKFNVHGRQVTYATDMRSEVAQVIRSNPHRFNLAQIGLRLTHEDGSPAAIDELTDINQTLALWTGAAESHFEFAGQPITVRTIAHPDRDAVAFSVESPLVASGQLAIEVRFAYPAGVWGPKVDDWDSPEKHSTEATQRENAVRFLRQMDETGYVVDVTTELQLKPQDKPHHYLLTSEEGDTLEAVFHFLPVQQEAPEQLAFSQLEQASAQYWQQFWSTGGAIDLSESEDPRWRELERRIVLSQYVTTVNCAGSMPPQETGLVCNSWFGKSHLEMHWWHAAHFPLWDRYELLERSLGWYEEILPAARKIAERQGYAGVRWPKMTGPAGLSSPSEVGELLIWQQPHPIYFAEQAYRHDPSEKTLQRFSEIVHQTAAFMADYAHYEADSDRYVLGPVLIPAQECYDGRSKPGVYNPTYELAYWRWALETANRWRERQAMEVNAKWREVAEKIAKPHVRDGIYTAIENPPYLRRRDHPSMLAALGVLPDVGLVDRSIMADTLESVAQDWSWPDTWGWDYPMMAMTAARLDKRHEAIDYLLLDTPKNHYLPNGHCRQADRLPIYLPANGGLLTAVAMMAAGWDDVDPAKNAPGFPNDGTWKVRHEGLKRMP